MAGSSSTLGTSLLASERDGLDTRRNQVDRLAGRVGLSSRVHQHRGGVATIIGYHSVGDPLGVGGDPRMVLSPADFGAQMEFLASKRRVVSLDALLATLAAGDAPARGTVVLTIDDGYRDTLTTALPILQRLGLPATVYLSGGFIGGSRVMPVDDLYWSITQRRRHELPDALVAERVRDRSVAAHADAGHRTSGLRRVGDPDHRPRARRARRRARVGARCARSRRSAARTDDDLGRGGDARAQRPRSPWPSIPHRHADLRAFPDLLDDEFCATRDAIEAATGVRPLDTSYAYNRQGPGAAARVAELGFRSALGAGASRVVAAGTSPFALMRIDGPRDLDLLRAWTL